MAKVFEIGITHRSGNKIIKIDSVDAIAGKGLVNDRFFKDNNHKNAQLTLIEKENIDDFNTSLKAPIPYINFRRNIITEGIKLNELIGKEICLGEVKIKIHELCEPCKHLQDLTKQENLVKKLLHKGGIRSEILSNGKIFINDSINYK